MKCYNDSDTRNLSLEVHTFNVYHEILLCQVLRNEPFDIGGVGWGVWDFSSRQVIFFLSVYTTNYFFQK